MHVNRKLVFVMSLTLAVTSFPAVAGANELGGGADPNAVTIEEGAGVDGDLEDRIAEEAPTDEPRPVDDDVSDVERDREDHVCQKPWNPPLAPDGSHPVRLTVCDPHPDMPSEPRPVIEEDIIEDETTEEAPIEEDVIEDEPINDHSGDEDVVFCEFPPGDGAPEDDMVFPTMFAEHDGLAAVAARSMMQPDAAARQLEHGVQPQPAAAPASSRNASAVPPRTEQATPSPRITHTAPTAAVSALSARPAPQVSKPSHLSAAGLFMLTVLPILALVGLGLRHRMAKPERDN